MPERGGITTSATPVSGVNKPASVVAVRAVLLDERLSVVAEVGRQDAGVACGQQPVAEREHDPDRADEQRHADQRVVEQAEAAGAGSSGRVRRDHVHRAAGQQQQ